MILAAAATFDKMSAAVRFKKFHDLGSRDFRSDELEGSSVSSLCECLCPSLLGIAEARCVRIEVLRIERVIAPGMSFEPVNGLRVFRMLRLTKDFQEMLITGNASTVFGRTGAPARDAPWIFMFRFAQ